MFWYLVLVLLSKNLPRIYIVRENFDSLTQETTILKSFEVLTRVQMTDVFFL